MRDLRLPKLRCHVVGPTGCHRQHRFGWLSIRQTTSRPGLPTLTTTALTVNKADLPTGLMSVYKFFLKASALTANARQGWQIQSIAVNGSQ